MKAANPKAHALILFAGLLLVAGCASPREDYTLGESEICKVHGIHMTKTLVPIEYGLIRPDEEGLARYAASTNSFPNAEDWVAGGCCVGPARQAVIYTCPECKRVRAEWEAEHTDQSPRAADLRSPCVYVDGEVQTPCRCVWTNGLTLADAIHAAGGFTSHAKMSGVTIHHDTAMAEKVNCSRQPPSRWGSTPLAPGDLVHVPKRAGFNLPTNKPHSA